MAVATQIGESDFAGVSRELPFPDRRAMADQIWRLLASKGMDQAAIGRWWEKPAPALGGRRPCQLWGCAEYDAVHAAAEAS